MNDLRPADPIGFFDGKAADAYDRRNNGLRPIADALHFLVRLILHDLPEEARVLCVGVGTGAEMLSLAADHPGWRFVGVDPSPDMLAIGRRRLDEAGFAARCKLVQGYTEDVSDRGFDAVVSLLVAHFVRLEDRPAFYSAAHERLKPGGRYVSAEISCELDGLTYPEILADWKQVQRLMGANEESLASLAGMLRNVLGVVAPAATEALWRDAGFPRPVAFFQAFMIRGWHARMA